MGSVSEPLLPTLKLLNEPLSSNSLKKRLSKNSSDHQQHLPLGCASIATGGGGDNGVVPKA
jgi:hypothetical protein